MANYTFVGPDDKKYQFTGPRGLSPADIDIVKNNFFQPPVQEAPPPVAEEPKGATGFLPSVMRGGRGIYSLLGDVAPAMAAQAFGKDEYAKKQLEEAAAYQKETERLYPAEVASYKDINSVGKALTYIKESIGEAIPSIIPSILTGGAAAAFSRPAIAAAEKAALNFAEKQIAEAAAKGIVTDATVEGIRKAALEAGAKEAQKIVLKYEASGALAGSAAQNIPDVYQNIYEATGKQDLGAALAFGGFNAALDAITPISLLQKMRKSGISPEQVGAAWYKRAGKGALQGFVTEGGTEALQEVSSASAEKFVDQNQQFFSEKNFERFINAGLKGGFGGAGITAATDVAFGKGPQKEEVPPTAEGELPALPAPDTTPPDIPPAPPFTGGETFKIHPAGYVSPTQTAPAPAVDPAKIEKLKKEIAKSEEELAKGIHSSGKKGTEKSLANKKRGIDQKKAELKNLLAGAQNVGQPIPPAGGEGAGLPSATGTDTSTEGTGGAESARVVRPGEDVAGTAEREATQSTPVNYTVQDLLASGEADKDVPDFTEPKQEAPIKAEPIPEVTVNASAQVDELIKQRETELAQLEAKRNALYSGQGRPTLRRNSSEKTKKLITDLDAIDKEIADAKQSLGFLMVRKQTEPEVDQETKLRQEIEAQQATEGEERRPFGERYVPPVIKTPEEIKAEQQAAFDKKVSETPVPTKLDIGTGMKFDEKLVGSLYDEEKDLPTPGTEGERTKLPAWDALTRDQKDLYLGYITENNALEHEEGRKALIRYREELREVNRQDAQPELDVINKFNPEDFQVETEEELKALEDAHQEKLDRLKLQISRIKANPASAAYVFNRKAESDKQKFKFPEWSELTARERKIFKGTLEGLVGKRVDEDKKPITNLNEATAEEISLAFNRLGEVLIRKINRRNEANATPANAAYEEAQAEIKKEQEAKQEEELNRKKAGHKNEKVGRGKPSDKGWLPKHVVEQIKKNKNFDAVIQYLRTASADPLPKAVAQLLYGLKLKTKIEFVDKLPKKRLAEYDPKSDTIYVTSFGLKDRIVLHEVVHAGTVKVINEYLTKYKKGAKHSLTDDQIDAAEHLEELMEYAQSEMSNTYPDAFENLYEFVGYALSDRDFQDSLANLPMEGIRTSELPNDASLWTDFVYGIVKLLNWTKAIFSKTGEVKRENALLEALAGFERIIATPPEEGIEMAPLAAKETKQADREFETRSADKILDDARKSVRVQQHTPKSVVKSVFSRHGFDKAVEFFQNDRAPLKKLFDRARKFGVVTLVGEKPNDVWNYITRSIGISVDKYEKELHLDIKTLDDAIEAYANKKGLPVDKALEDLHLAFEAMHEPERRRVKFLMNMKLDEQDQRYELYGKTYSADGLRRAIVDLLSKQDPSLSDEQRKAKARDLRKFLNEVVFDQNGKVRDAVKAPLSEAESKLMYSEEAPQYDVIAGRPPSEIKLIRDRVGSDKTDPEIKAIHDAMEQVRQKTITLNKEANYFSEPVANLVDFYGFEYYVPFKGAPKDKAINEEFNFDSKRIGGDFQEGQDSFQGRESESNNPVLQLRADAVNSALRAGRKDIPEVIVNAINDKIIKGHHVTDIKFSERYGNATTTEKLAKIRGVDKIFWYKPDGTISVYQVDNREISSAIKRSYRISNPLVNLVDSLTSGIGQTHTRYNPAFAPMNFVRDAFTNAGIIGAEFDPVTAGKLIAGISSDVANNGLARTFKYSNLYANSNFEEINKLAGGNKSYEELTDKERYFRDLVDYVEMGGKVSYLQGVAAKGALDQLAKEIGRSGIMRKKDQFDKFIDIYNDMFELSSRVATYRLMKNVFYKENKDNGMSDANALEDARLRAVEYAKNLANFEQVGRWGKQAGAIFMFFRPAATGAVRAIEALSPMFRLLPTHMGGFDEQAFIKQAKEEGRTDEQIERAVAAMQREANSAARMALVMGGIGVAFYMMALMLAGDDEQGRNRIATDDMSRWTRYARFFIPGIERPFQLPWGFGPGAFASAGAQIAALTTGRTSIGDAFSNIFVSGMDSFLPLPVSRISPIDNFPAWAMDSVTPSAFRPFFEYVMNLDGLGREIYNNRQTRYGDAYTGGDSIPETYKAIARTLFKATDGALDISPNTMYFFASNYLDGFAKAATATFDIGLSATGQKDFDVKTDMPFLGSFMGTKSNVDAREFSKVEEKVKSFDKRINSLKDKPELLSSFLQSEDAQKQFAAVQFYNNQVNGQLRQLRTVANQIRANDEFSPRERKTQLEEIINMQNIVKRQLLNVFADMDIKP
jgi:hypothetical protein